MSPFLCDQKIEIQMNKEKKPTIPHSHIYVCIDLFVRLLLQDHEGI